MSGPAIRAVEIAKAPGGRRRGVTLAVPTAPDVDGAWRRRHRDLRYPTRPTCGGSRTRPTSCCSRATPSGVPEPRRTSAVLVADLYDPWLFENIELHTGEADGRRDPAAVTLRCSTRLHRRRATSSSAPPSGNATTGWACCRRGSDSTQAQYATDPSLRHLIDVVPFGLPDREPERRARVLKGVHPGIAADDELVVLWGGGTWDWFDPLTLVEAWPSVRRAGAGRQASASSACTSRATTCKHMRVAHQATVRGPSELGLTDTSVFFGDWVPYDLRESYLLEADLGVTVARDLAETRLVVPHPGARLPVGRAAGRHHRRRRAQRPGAQRTARHRRTARRSPCAGRGPGPAASGPGRAVPRWLSARARSPDGSAGAWPSSRCARWCGTRGAGHSPAPTGRAPVGSPRSCAPSSRTSRTSAARSSADRAQRWPPTAPLCRRASSGSSRILRDYPYLVRAVHRARKAKQLGPRATAEQVRAKAGAKWARRRGR